MDFDKQLMQMVWTMTVTVESSSELESDCGQMTVWEADSVKSLVCVKNLVAASAEDDKCG